MHCAHTKPYTIDIQRVYIWLDTLNRKTHTVYECHLSFISVYQLKMSPAKNNNVDCVCSHMTECVCVCRMSGEEEDCVG